MLHLTYQGALVLHILGGACGLILFWTPMLSRKGGSIHRSSGQWYYWAMMLVAASAVVLSGANYINPMVGEARSFADLQARTHFIEQSRLSALFLAQLAVMLFTNLHFATRVLKVRTQRQQLRSIGHLWPLAALFLVSLYSGALGIQHGKILLQGFAGLGVFTVISNWRYIYAEAVPARSWLAMHVRNIIPSGIAAYTAFFVVGASSWLGDSNWRLLPWIAPAVLGSAVIFYYSRQVLQVGKLNTASQHKHTDDNSREQQRTGQQYPAQTATSVGSS